MGICDLLIDGLRVPFPFDSIYPEQVRYMHHLKRALDQRGQGLLEMPTGTGKTVSVFALICAYQRVHPEMGKLIFCTRTVPEMSKALRELRTVMEYQDKIFGDGRPFLGLGLSARKNMCVNSEVLAGGEAESVNGKCRELTFSDIEDTSSNLSLQSSSSGCSFYRGFKTSTESVISGVFTIEELKLRGMHEGWCPYYQSRRLLQQAHVVVYSYQYLLDARVSASAPLFPSSVVGAQLGLNSGNLDEPGVVVFDEAHNIDEVCIESLTVKIDRNCLSSSANNIKRLRNEVADAKKKNEQSLKDEVERLTRGLTETGQMTQAAAEAIKVNPAELLTPEQRNSLIPGTIRKADHFLTHLDAMTAYLRQYITVDKARVEGPLMFLHNLEAAAGIDGRTLKGFSERLRSLVSTLRIVDVNRFLPLSDVCELCSLIGTHSRGFAVLTDPYPEIEGVYDPQVEMSCLDASIAMRLVTRRFKTVILTSGTLSPLHIYPQLLGMERVVVREALTISLERESIRPLVVTRGNDQVMMSSKFDLREDVDVLNNYGHLLEELVQTVPDGMVCFFTSKLYMRKVVKVWFESGLLTRLASHKPVFFETEDVVETTYALANYRKACDQGKGGLFLSIARGKVSEGIDFDRHYGRCVVMCGIPFQYTLSKRLRARLEYVKETHNVQESEFLTFDAMRAAAQCVGRVLRSKQDYGIMVFADCRYARSDKRNKLPEWIGKFLVPSLLNLTVDMAVASAREFLISSSQPFQEIPGPNPSKLDGSQIASWIKREIRNDVDPTTNLSLQKRVIQL